MDLVNIPRERLTEYPHQFSGGMRQRLVIAILRKSGTEPLIRVMVEGQNAADVKQYALDIAKAVKENC